MNNVEIKKLQNKYNFSEDYIKENIKPVVKDNCTCKNETHSCTYFDVAKQIYLNIRV